VGTAQLADVGESGDGVDFRILNGVADGADIHLDVLADVEPPGGTVLGIVIVRVLRGSRQT
jgi:hypothetical protein